MRAVIAADRRIARAVRRATWRGIACAVAIALGGVAPAQSPAMLLSEFIHPAPPYPQAHASTLVELPDHRLAAAWFGGSGEGRPDVTIWFAWRSDKGWSTPVAVADGRDGDRRYPTWNPVLFQPPGQPLHLF